MAEYGKTYRAANAAKIKARRQAWNKVNAVKIAAQTKTYREANSDAIKAWRAADYVANTEQIKASAKAWKRAHPVRVNELSRENIGRRRARKNGAIVTKADYAVILAKHGMKCHICGGDILTRADLHFDHVIALANGGVHSPENILPSHAFCNLSKGVRVI
jgi:5-methylcytosine-specific restriction endonuclease McrA